MPFDDFFSSKPISWSKEWREQKKQAAIHKFTYPTGGGFKPGHKYYPKQVPLDTEQIQVERAIRGKT